MKKTVIKQWQTGKFVRGKQDDGLPYEIPPTYLVYNQDEKEVLSLKALDEGNLCPWFQAFPIEAELHPAAVKTAVTIFCDLRQLIVKPNVIQQLRLKSASASLRIMFSFFLHGWFSMDFPWVWIDFPATFPCFSSGYLEQGPKMARTAHS